MTESKATTHSSPSTGEVASSSRSNGLTSSQPESTRRFPLNAAFVALVAVLTHFSWPQAFEVPLDPIPSFIILASIFLALVSVLDRTGQWQATQGRALASIAFCILAAWVTCRGLIVEHPSIGGVDFFYYVCVARDLIHGAEDVAMTRYGYFPGVYLFWKFGLWLSGGALEGLQWLYLAVLVANALLLSVLLWRAIGSWFPGAVAGFWYLALCTRLGAIEGITEPLCSLPLLLALCVWGGHPLRGSLGGARSALLGVGLGIALTMKQPAGLFSIGATSLLLSNLVHRPAERHEWKWLLLIPAAAAASFAFAMTLEGEGLEPIVRGLSIVRDYDSHGTLWGNLRHLERRAPWIFAGAAIGGIGWMGSVGLSSLRRRWPRHCFELAGFALFAGVATLIQFWKRSHGHYALLPAPMFILLTILSITIVYRSLPSRAKTHPLMTLVLVVLTMIPFTRPFANWNALYLWPPALFRAAPMTRGWEGSPLRDSVEVVRPHIVPGEDTLLVPPRQNVVHFVLGTRSSSFGYGWGGTALLQPVLRSPSLVNVLVFKPEFQNAKEVRVCERLGCRELIEDLPSQGFRPVVDAEAMTLWRRSGAAAMPTRSAPPSATDRE